MSLSACTRARSVTPSLLKSAAVMSNAPTFTGILWLSIRSPSRPFNRMVTLLSPEPACATSGQPSRLKSPATIVLAPVREGKSVRVNESGCAKAPSAGIVDNATASAGQKCARIVVLLVVRSDGRRFGSVCGAVRVQRRRHRRDVSSLPEVPALLGTNSVGRPAVETACGAGNSREARSKLRISSVAASPPRSIVETAHRRGSSESTAHHVVRVATCPVLTVRLGPR